MQFDLQFECVGLLREESRVALVRHEETTFSFRKLLTLPRGKIREGKLIRNFRFENQPVSYLLYFTTACNFRRIPDLSFEKSFELLAEQGNTKRNSDRSIFFFFFRTIRLEMRITLTLFDLFHASRRLFLPRGCQKSSLATWRGSRKEDNYGVRKISRQLPGGAFLYPRIDKTVWLRNSLNFTAKRERR